MLGCLQSNLLYESAGFWVLLSSFIGFLAMGIDKSRAVRGEWRVPEKTLFIIAAAGGALGMVVGGAVFRHKTSKLSFMAVLIPMVVFWLLLLRQTGFLGCVSSYLP